MGKIWGQDSLLDALEHKQQAKSYKNTRKKCREELIQQKRTAGDY